MSGESEVTVIQILRGIVPSLGARLVLADGGGGYVEFADGRRRFFNHCCFDFNGHGAARLAGDTLRARALLHRFGYRIPDHITLHDPVAGLDEVQRFIRQVSYPVVVKPAEPACRPRAGWNLRKVSCDAELADAVEAALAVAPAAIVERFYPGHDYRILSTTRRLVAAWRQPRLALAEGELDISDRIDASYRTVAPALCRDMGLALCGIHLVCRDMTQPPRAANDYVVLAITGAPDCTRFAGLGGRQRRIIEDLIKEMLIRLRDGA